MSSTIDLSDFTVSISYMDEMVRYFDETDNQDKEARECEVTWTHNTLSLTPKKYYLRENHVYWESNIAGRQIEILEEWLEELGHDPKKYDLDRNTKIFKLKGKLNDEQVQNWLKPNGQQTLNPTTVGEI